MKLTKAQLERKIANLNKWLKKNPKTHYQRKYKEQNRTYYIKKLVELEDQQLITINA